MAAPINTGRTCCGTVVGDTHRDCPATGHNRYGVAMCRCGRSGLVHAFEPGESCSPRRVLPPCFRDVQGDLWMLDSDGLLHSPETRPFPREHVERKWGPLVEVTV